MPIPRPETLTGPIRLKNQRSAFLRQKTEWFVPATKEDGVKLDALHGCQPPRWIFRAWEIPFLKLKCEEHGIRLEVCF